MKNRNALLGTVVVVALILAAGIFWWTKQAPVEKPVVASAPVKPAVPVSAPVVMHTAEVAAPTAPVVAPSANPKPAEASVAAATPAADLNTTVSNLITTLQSGDVDAFVQNFLVPSLKDVEKAAMEDQARRNPNVNLTPEMKAQMEQMMEQRMPMMIQQITDEMKQRPDTMQGFQKMATALQSAQATPPQMNEAGDRATYTLQTNGDKDIPASIFFVRRDGKWTLDMTSMVEGGL